MEVVNAELRPIGHTEARRVYDMLRRYRDFDTSSTSEQSFDDWLVSAFPRSQYYEWLEDGVVTFVSLGNIDMVNRVATMGIFTEKPGHGYGYRAGLALLSLAFDTLGLNRIVCTVRSDNNRCLNTCERHAAMKYEGTARSALFRNGRFIDMEIFAMLADDWRKANGRYC